MRCSATGCVHGKRTGMGKAVQDLHALGKFTYREAVIFLIQEESCFLPVLDIYGVTDTVLRDLCSRGKTFGRREEVTPVPVLFERKTFLLAKCGLVSLEDAAYGNAVFLQFFDESSVDDVLDLLGAVGEDLGREDIFITVDGEARDAVCFAEDQAAAGIIVLHDGASHIECVLHAAMPERIAECFVGVVGKDADTDLAALAEKTRAEITSLRREDVHQ